MTLGRLQARLLSNLLQNLSTVAHYGICGLLDDNPNVDNVQVPYIGDKVDIIVGLLLDATRKHVRLRKMLSQSHKVGTSLSFNTPSYTTKKQIPGQRREQMYLALFMRPAINQEDKRVQIPTLARGFFSMVQIIQRIHFQSSQNPLANASLVPMLTPKKLFVALSRAPHFHKNIDENRALWDRAALHADPPMFKATLIT